MFLSVSGLSNTRELSEDKVSNKLAKFMKLPVLEIFHAGLYVYGGFRVVGVGCTLEHRLRTACVGLAALKQHPPRLCNDIGDP